MNMTREPAANRWALGAEKLRSGDRRHMILRQEFRVLFVPSESTTQPLSQISDMAPGLPVLIEANIE